MTPRRIFILAGVLALAAGCSSSQDRLAKEMDQVASSAATAQLVLESWSRGSVPRRYTVDTLQDLDRSLTSSSQKLREGRDLPGTMRERALGVIGELQTNLRLQASNVRDGQHVAAAGAVSGLHALQARAHTLARAAGSER